MIGMKRDTSIAAALQALAPNASWVVRENNFDNIEWHSEDMSQPTKQQIEAKMAELEASAGMDSVRDIRNWYLRESDWTQAMDIRNIRGEAWSLAWDQYRQELRDITTSEITPYFDDMGILKGVEFPKKPAS
jgi:hypothetical protein